MKVLIVDDKVANQEAVAEILVDAKYEVERSSNIMDAVSKLRTLKPDIVILNAQIGTDDISTVTAISKLVGARVLLLREPDKQIPKNDTIAGYIESPFKNVDIVAKVNSLANEMKKKEKGFLVRLFTKESKNENVKDNLPNVEFGKSYVIFENEPSVVYKAIEHFTEKDYDVFLATRKVKFISEKLEGYNNKIKILKLSEKLQTDYIETSRLGTITDQIKKFIAEKDQPVIVFDDLLVIIEVNGLNNAMTMLYQVLNSGINKQMSLVVSINDNALTNDDKESFLNNIDQYGIQGDFDVN